MSEIITFYSYKGGVGRSMCLSNVAATLAKWGFKVLIVDFDLEAPGLQYFFSDFIRNFDQVGNQKGVINLLNDDSIDWKDIVIPININTSSIEYNTIDLIVSGNKNDPSYITQLRFFNASDFYKNHHGGNRIETLRDEWKKNYDYILIDSRTGITDLGGICTIQLPDVLVVLFTATNQGWNGTKDVVLKAIRNQNEMSYDRERLKILTIPTRVDNSENDLMKFWLNKFSEDVKDMIGNWMSESVGIQDFIYKISIPYVAYYSYGERLAVINETSNPLGIGYAIDSISSLIANNLNNIPDFFQSRDTYVKKMVDIGREKFEKDFEVYPVYEGQVILLGNPRAGKTSLVNKLINTNAELPSEEKRTRGIEAKKYIYENSKKEKFSIRILDFSGQTIYYSLFNLYLNNNSLYVIVLDSETDYITNGVDYWLDSIKEFGGSSPIIVFLNEKFGRSINLDRQRILHDYSNIKSIYQGDLKDLRVVENLRNIIEMYIYSLAYNRSQLPHNWKKIKNELELLRNQGVFYISLKKYFSLCQQHGLSNKENMLSLSSYLHNQGLILHFQDAYELNEIIFLDTEWIQEPYFRLFVNEKSNEKDGYYTREDLMRIWGDTVPVDMILYLLHLFTHFEFCFKLSDRAKEIYIFPDLLPLEIRLSESLKTADGNSLKFCYQHIPRTLFHRLLIKLDIIGLDIKKLYRNHINLEKEDSLADIFLISDKEEIVVFAKGRHANGLMLLICESIKNLNESYKSLNAKIYLPCICSVCISDENPTHYDYENLIRRIQVGKKTLECNKSFLEVSITSILLNIFPSESLPLN